MSIPPAYKTLLSVVKRAEELEKSSFREERIVAYFCRFHAVSKAVKLSKTPSPEENKFINDQMTKLEAMKPSLNMAPNEGERVCRDHAHKVFSKADDVDRSGMADKAIAKLFYAAGTFFDILEQFGPLDSETIHKKKYAKWKAAEILNAINAGVTPTAGGYGEGMVVPDDESSASAPASAPSPAPATAPAPAPVYTPKPDPSLAAPPADPYNMHIPSPPGRAPSSVSTVVLPSSLSAANQPPATAPATARPPAPATASGGSFQAPKGVSLSSLDVKARDAAELASFAITSLKHKDIETAKVRLQQALDRLNL
eukprot:gene30317-36636_t